MVRKKVLKFIVLAMLLVGLAFACTPFIRAWNVPAGAILKWQHELDISGMQPGQLRSFSKESDFYFVYRRTPEQIEWLLHHEPIEATVFILRYDEEYYGSPYRSVSKEWFVFKAHHWSRSIYLQERVGFHRCGSIRSYEGIIPVRDDQLFLGAITCSGEGVTSDRLLDSYFVYDVAGRSAASFVAPLSVPYHSFNRQGNVVVGPKP